MRRQTTSEVNAGSMADIAFLLLIFFLVTTTIDKDKGIARQLPPPVSTKSEVLVKQKNLLEIVVNAKNEIQVDQDLATLKDIRLLTIAFLDNGGFPKGHDGYCAFCLGDRDILSSDSPQKAVISIAPDRLTNYETYVQIQNEISSAYAYLRNRESQRLFGFEFTEVNTAIKNDTYKGNAAKTKSHLKTIRAMYPMLISEAETQKKLRL